MKNKFILVLVLLLGLFYSVTFTVQAQTSTAVYTTLCFSKIDANLGPYFFDDTTQVHFYSSIWTSTKSVLSASRTDFNGLVTFKAPSGTQVTLYVALHRFSATDIAICIQKSSEEGKGGIPANWWQTEP